MNAIAYELVVVVARYVKASVLKFGVTSTLLTSMLRRACEKNFTC